MCLIFYMSGSISWMRIQTESYNFEGKQDWWKEGGWIKRRRQKEGEMSRKKGAGRWRRGAFQWLPLSKEYISNSSIWNFKPESNGKTLLGSALSLPPNEWYQYFAYLRASKCLQFKQPLQRYPSSPTWLWEHRLQSTGTADPAQTLCPWVQARMLSRALTCGLNSLSHSKQMATTLTIHRSPPENQVFAEQSKLWGKPFQPSRPEYVWVRSRLFENKDG